MEWRNKVANHKDFEDRQLDLLQKLANRLNTTGYKLRDLQLCLLEEEKWVGGGSFDHATFDPLLDRYEIEVENLDLLKALYASGNLTHSLMSDKPSYQCYLEELLLQRSNHRRNLCKSSAVQIAPDCNSESHDVVLDSTDFVDSPTFAPTYSDVTSATTDSHSHSHKASMKISSEEGLKEISEESDLDFEANENHIGFSNTLSSRDNHKYNERFYLKTVPLKREIVEDSSWINSELLASTPCSSKYSVVKNRDAQKSRKPIPEEFFHYQKYSPKSKSPFKSLQKSCSFNNIQIPSPTLTNTAESNVIEDENGSCKTPAWASKSKSSNESWYEFKERCSISPMHEHLNSQSKLRLSSPGPSFLLRDYMKTGSPTGISPTKKSARFSASPSRRIALKKSLQTSQTKYSSDSSDDDVGFEDVEFPLAKNLDRSWTNDRRSPRRH